MSSLKDIKAIIGLGNPGPKFYYNRHNIGFRIADAIAEKYNANWESANKMELAELAINEKNILLIKPTTFMNSSGEVIPFLKKKGISPENVLVVHDELELPFGISKIKFDGSSKGHNGLKSIISFYGSNFFRLRIGIGRPEKKEDVPDFVLQNFNKNEESKLPNTINNAISEIESQIFF